MGVMTALAVGLGVFGAVNSYSQGKAKSTEAKVNAQIKDQEAQLATVAQEVEASQYNRDIGRVSSKTVARTGKSGFTMSGSPMAVLLDTQTQMEMDKTIGQYNLEVQKRFALSEAAQYRVQAKNYMSQGITRGFTKLLSTGLDYSMKSGFAKI